MFWILKLRRQALLVTTAILVIALPHVTDGILGGGSSGNRQPVEAAITTVGSAQTLTSRLEVEVITLQAHGFEPVEITRPQGRFVLGIDNRSGREDIDLRLERAEGGRVAALEARNRRLSWRDEVDLPPGQYVVRATNQHEWSCLITITSR